MSTIVLYVLFWILDCKIVRERTLNAILTVFKRSWIELIEQWKWTVLNRWLAAEFIWNCSYHRHPSNSIWDGWKKRTAHIVSCRMHAIWSNIQYPPNVEKQCNNWLWCARLVMRKDYFVKNRRPTTFCAQIS